MDDSQIRQALLDILRRIAPEVEPGTLLPDAKLRDQVDLDSMDFLNLVVGLHERLGIDIPEADYARLTTPDAITAYLKAKLG